MGPYGVPGECSRGPLQHDMPVQQRPNTISYPASDANVVAVALLDAASIANTMSSRGVDDGNDLDVDTGEVELAGGGFVIESTSMDGCYATMSGTSMSTPSVAGFAAANWQPGGAFATRAYLQDMLAEDINNTGRASGYDDTAAGFDAITGYGLPRVGAGTDGSILAGVNAVQASVGLGATVNIHVTGPTNSNYRIGVSSPGGGWTFGEFTTDGIGFSGLTLGPWTDPGTWLLTVDFGGIDDFGAAIDTFEQTN